MILIVLSYGDFSLIQVVRLEVTELLAPAVSAARAPEEFLQRMQQNFSAFVHQKDKILQLQEVNQKLQESQVWVRQIQQENQELRSLLKIPQEKYKIVARARVLSYPGTPYIKSILLGVGKKQGVAPLQAVVTPYGLVGRVTDVGETSSRVILITDLNAQIPVMTKPGNVNAILTGNNTEVPRLKYIQDAYGPIAVGDKVETSASGGVFPSGIPVGTVRKIDGGHILIKPEVELENLTFVTIIKLNETTEILGGES
jgi:rod shape-determining protein MreC